MGKRPALMGHVAQDIATARGRSRDSTRRRGLMHENDDTEAFTALVGLISQLVEGRFLISTNVDSCIVHSTMVCTT